MRNNNNTKIKQSNFSHTLHEIMFFIRSVDVNTTFLNVFSIITAPIVILSCPRLTITCLKRNRYLSFKPDCWIRFSSNFENSNTLFHQFWFSQCIFFIFSNDGFQKLNCQMSAHFRFRWLVYHASTCSFSVTLSKNIIYVLFFFLLIPRSHFLMQFLS